ncbi:MAG: RNA polymerase sigma factor [Ruminococcus sp.]|nr:RNA polymerase sigma factor [Ruminococcus sp.]
MTAVISIVWKGDDGMPDNSEIRARVELLVERYSNMIFRLAYQNTGSLTDAEDIFGDVCLAMLTKKAPLYDEEHIRNWLVRVTLNKCRNLTASSARRLNVSLSAASSMASPVHEDILSEVMSLPPKYRTVLYLHYYEGYSIAEVADLMHAKPATVGTWLSRARKRLKILLEE